MLSQLPLQLGQEPANSQNLGRLVQAYKQLHVTGFLASETGAPSSLPYSTSDLASQLVNIVFRVCSVLSVFLIDVPLN